MRILRAMGAGWKETLGFVPRLISILRQLWLEVMGFVFFTLALFFALSANGLVQSWQQLERDPGALPRFLLALAFVLLFCWFGWSSFRRAKRFTAERNADEKS